MLEYMLCIWWRQQGSPRSSLAVGKQGGQPHAAVPLRDVDRASGNDDESLEQLSPEGGDVADAATVVTCNGGQSARLNGFAVGKPRTGRANRYPGDIWQRRDRQFLTRAGGASISGGGVLAGGCSQVGLSPAKGTSIACRTTRAGLACTAKPTMGGQSSIAHATEPNLIISSRPLRNEK